MHDQRIPKILLYGELAEEKRPSGRPKLRYNDNFKETLKSLSIPVENWEDIAPDRLQWRGAVHQGERLAETRRSTLAATKREARKAREENPAQPQPSLQCSICYRCFRARIGLISHSRTHKDN
ncbi:Hypp5883 [Branchiostoma lanceolatum]|uniref:Hypp5883 protein n=1 Tax=Branchiostoma lanceolatum TaxID=7740 RepID=A0A8J9YSJ6_BRALA|nr:Hypp5883 [Branchiostoma lanceolatum]